MASFLLHRSLRSIAKLLKARDWNPGAISVGMTGVAVIFTLFCHLINSAAEGGIINSE